MPLITNKLAGYYPFKMTRHERLFLVRILLAVGILAAGPYAHVQWGEPYPGDGQQAFGVIGLMTIFCAVSAFVYFAIGSGIQYLLRRKPSRWTTGFDITIFTLVAGLLVYGGITAHYSNNGKSGEAVKPSVASNSLTKSVMTPTNANK
jgi:hypothetical protein